MTDIDAKVASILSSTSLAINVGSGDGVGLNDQVSLWDTVDVTDPDTKELLGSVRMSKLRLYVTDVQPKFCIANVRTQTNFGAMQIFASTPVKLISTAASADSKHVKVRVGELVTVTLAESEDNGESE